MEAEISISKRDLQSIEKTPYGVSKRDPQSIEKTPFGVCKRDLQFIGKTPYDLQQDALLVSSTRANRNYTFH